MNNRKLDDDLLENVNGGYLYNISGDVWKVVDNNGSIVHTSGSYESAKSFAIINGHCIHTISEDDIEKTRTQLRWKQIILKPFKKGFAYINNL